MELNNRKHLPFLVLIFLIFLLLAGKIPNGHAAQSLSKPRNAHQIQDSDLFTKNQKWITHKVGDHIFPTSHIVTIFAKQDGTKWFGTSYGAYVLNDGNTPFDKTDDVVGILHFL